ncbi:hypothetical protein PYW07_014164 [Mythimna separata]|uniref:Exonuclease domain-containing protein n=1 Tax=Mythimna separata TaxID=271217 RepID=A0AAD8DZ83_MYTSE|nr:hypothetical protein PYW07_014164 [Mythimna separata]
MAPIQVFVFLNFGSTGRRAESSSLTHLCLLAISRDQYLEPDNIEVPPNKLCLDLKSGFNRDTYDILNNFINLQQKPICLVSHCGMDYDFQILKRELDNLKVRLSDDLLCADSIYAFYDILKDKIKDDDDDDDDHNLSVKLESSSSNNDCLESNKHEIKKENQEEMKDEKIELESNKQEIKKENQEEMKDENTPDKHTFDATGKSNGLSPENARKKPKLSKEENRYRGKVAVRNRYYDGDYFSKSHGLRSIYEEMMEYPTENVTQAEMDVYMNFRISHQLGERFLEWTDEVQLKFAKVRTRPIFMKDICLTKQVFKGNIRKI